MTLDFKQVIDRVHDAAGYAKYIYDGDPSPPLPEEDALWAREVIRRTAAPPRDARPR